MSELTSDERSFLRDYLLKSVIKKNNIYLEKLLKNGGDTEIRDRNGNTLLMIAAQDNPEAVDMLLKYGAKVFTVNVKGETPLMIAAKNNIEALKSLIVKRAFVNVLDQSGNSPITLAANYNPGAVPILLRAGANPNHLDSNGQTPLTIAVKKHPDLVEILLRFKADIDMKNEDGKTALAVAATEINDPGLTEQMMRLLITNGADTGNAAPFIDEFTPAAKNFLNKYRQECFDTPCQYEKSSETSETEEFDEVDSPEPVRKREKHGRGVDLWPFGEQLSSLISEEQFVKWPSIDLGVYVGQSFIQGGGLGLFAERVFQKGDIVTFFDGTIMSRADADDLRKAGKATHITVLVPQLFYLDGKDVPNETGRGGGSFANDKRFMYYPETEEWKYSPKDINNTKKETKVIKGFPTEKVEFLIAKQKIMPGEEITTSYGKGYFEYGKNI